jgi:hypothetical protein
MVSLLFAKEDPTLRLRPVDITNPIHGCTDRASPVPLTWEGYEAAVLPKILDTDETLQDLFDLLGRVRCMWIDFPSHLFFAVFPRKKMLA